MIFSNSKKQLTKRQFAILEYIIKYVQSRMYQPNMKEIAEEFEISISGAYNHLIVISSKGWIEIGDNQKRRIEISAEAIALVNGELDQKEWVKE